jgi:hypothetical protein
VREDDGDGINGDDAELTEPQNWRRIRYSVSTYALTPNAQTHIVLPGGTYFFTDLDLSGGATLEIAGHCRIYVTGKLDLTGGGLLNATGLPTQCQIYAHPYVIPSNHNPAKASVIIEGGAHMAAAIYAPFRDATILGNGHLFGAIIAESITVTGDAMLHYDEALGDIQGVNEVFIERLYWREIAVPPR